MPKASGDPGLNMSRRHDLDALRATAMLLGIAYHAALSSATGFPWMVRDVSQNRGLYLFQAGVHGFRMPLFFLVSGFFTAMLWRKRGLKSLFWNRFRRILLPCLLGLITIAPAVRWVSAKAIESEIRKRTQVAPKQPATYDLLAATALGDTNGINRLVAGGADINAMQGDFGITPLTVAALAGSAPTAELLLGPGGEPERPEPGWRHGAPRGSLPWPHRDSGSPCASWSGPQGQEQQRRNRRGLRQSRLASYGVHRPPAADLSRAGPGGEGPGPVKFANCGFWGTELTREQVLHEGGSSLVLTACHFTGWDRAGKGDPCIRASGRHLIVNGCEFMEEGKLAITLDKGLKAATVLGCTFQMPNAIQDQSGADVKVGLNTNA